MLTYEIIVKHLMPAVNNFSLQSNLIMNCKDFQYFGNLFDDTFYRYGVNTKLSLKNSILFCLDKNYHNLSEEYINNTLSDNIKTIVNDLEMNIIIFDFKNNKITSEYFGDFFNPWRPTIYLANYEEWWEPIVSKDIKIFSFSSSKANILKNNILLENISIRSSDEPITINDNFQEIISIEGYNEADNQNELDPFISPEVPTKNKLDKMKKDELIALCNTLNKVITISKPTKKDLIELIIN